MDVGLWQLMPELSDNRPNGYFFVITRDDDCDLLVTWLAYAMDHHGRLWLIARARCFNRSHPRTSNNLAGTSDAFQNQAKRNTNGRLISNL
jgi:hypothetical protein